MSTPLPLSDQIAGIEYARERLAAERAEGLALANADGLSQMDIALARLGAALTTLRWLARDRAGCVALLTTKMGG